MDNLSSFTNFEFELIMKKYPYTSDKASIIRISLERKEIPYALKDFEYILRDLWKDFKHQWLSGVLPLFEVFSQTTTRI